MSILTFFLAISGAMLLNAFFYLVIAALIFWVIWWFISWIGIPEPFNKVIKVVLGLIAVIILINFLLGLLGKGFINF